MNSYGVSRRVDELGRIVIPIEIRKALSIKEGENLEFNIKDDEIILKKKSVMKQNISILCDIEKSFASIIDGDYAISDRETILLSSDRKIIKNKLSDKIIELLNSLDEYTVITDDKISDTDIYVFPYSYENTKAGFIILYNISDISKYIKMIKFICTYINIKLNISQ